MKTNFIFGAVVVAIVALLALWPYLHISGTTHALLLIAGSVYLLVEMIRESTSFDKGPGGKLSGSKW